MFCPSGSVQSQPEPVNFNRIRNSVYYHGQKIRERGVESEILREIREIDHLYIYIYIYIYVYCIYFDGTG